MASAGSVGLQRAVLLDFDGTLFDLAQDLSGYRARWGDGPVAQTLGQLSGEQLAAALADLESADMEGVRNGRPLVSHELIRRIGAHFPTAIVSSNAVAAIAAGLERMGMGVGGLVVVGRESAPRLKPDPAPVHAALARLGVSGGVLVGDTTHDVEAARAAGITSVVVRNLKLAFQPEQADYYVTDLSELAGLLEEIWGRTI